MRNLHKTDRWQEDSQNPLSTDRIYKHTSDIFMPDLEDIGDISDSTLDNFLYPLTPDHELLFDMFATIHLTM